MDKTDPICGMKGTIPAHGHYFCSEHCIKKYEEQQGISEEKKYCPSCADSVKKKWYKERLFIIGMVVIVLLILGYFIPFLKYVIASFTRSFFVLPFGGF